jgi:hypothetical protein
MVIIYNKYSKNNLIRIYFFQDNYDINKNKTSIRLRITKNYFGHTIWHTDPFYPKEIYKDLNEISCYTSDAFAWLFGQFIKHVLKLNENTLKLIESKVKIIKNKKPLLGYKYLFK